MKIVEFIKKKKQSLIQLGGSLLLLLIAAGVGIFMGLKETNGLGKYVDEVYEYYEDSNWVALYKYAEYTGDEFINEYFFEQMSQSLYGEIDSSKLSLGDVDEDDGIATINLNYKDADGNSVTWKAKLSEKSEKNYLLFNQWKFDISDFIVKDCKVTALTDFQVYVDGVLLTEENAAKTEDTEQGTVTYTIPQIFKGEHTVYIKKDLLGVIEATVVWDEDGGSYVLDKEQLSLDQTETAKIQSSAETIVGLMYKAIFDEAGTDEVNGYFVQSEEVKAKLTSVYDNMLAAIQPEYGSTLNSISITGFTDGNVKLSYPSDVEVTIGFDCTFKARGPRNEGGGIREKYEGTATSTITLHFVRSGEEWLCSDLNMTCIDYSKKEEQQ